METNIPNVIEKTHKVPKITSYFMLLNCIEIFIKFYKRYYIKIIINLLIPLKFMKVSTII